MSQKPGGYRELVLWQKSMSVVKAIYELTEAFPDSEKYGLVSQMRRSAVSVPSNIAEGWGLQTTGAELRHVGIARGSIAELETQVEVAVRLEIIDASSVETLCSDLFEVGRIARGYEQYLENRSA